MPVVRASVLKAPVVTLLEVMLSVLASELESATVAESVLAALVVNSAERSVDDGAAVLAKFNVVATPLVDTLSVVTSTDEEASVERDVGFEDVDCTGVVVRPSVLALSVETSTKVTPSVVTESVDTSRAVDATAVDCFVSAPDVV